MKQKRLLVALSFVLVAGLLLYVAPVFAADAPLSRPGLGLRLGRSQGGLAPAIASILGTDLSQIQAQRYAGKSMAEIAQSAGISKEELVDRILAERKKSLDQLVKEGRLSQEQASLCLDNMKQRIEANLMRTSVGPPPWAGRAQGNIRGGLGRPGGRGLGPGTNWSR